MGCCHNYTRDNDSFRQSKNRFTDNFNSKISSMDQLDISPEKLFNQKVGSLDHDYEILDEIIFKGKSSIIKKGLHKLTGALVAIKTIQLDSLNQFSESARKNYLQGLETLKKINHPNLTKLIDIYQNESSISIITEYHNGGELFEKLMKNKSFSEQTCLKIITQILLGVNYLHKNLIVHRGITPENMVFEGNISNFLIKIIDFKLLTFLPEKTRLTEKVGAVYYIAPEILSENYDFKCDIWSCGILLFVMLCGRFPFTGNSNTEIFENIKAGKICRDSAEYKILSHEVKDFLDKLLIINPEERFTAYEALQHQWIKDTNANRNRENIANIMNFTALENLKKFQIHYKLQKIFWIYLINYFLRPNEKDELSNFFYELDKEGKGFLNKEDLINLLKKVKTSNEVDLEKEAKKIINSFGNVKDEEKISFTEFLMGSLDKNTFLNEDRIKLAFSSLDKSKCGSLTINDLKLEFGGERIADNVWIELILEVKPNKDYLTLEDFKHIILKT